MKANGSGSFMEMQGAGGHSMVFGIVHSSCIYAEVKGVFIALQ